MGWGVDPSTHTVYVANGRGGTVSVIDGANNTFASTIGVGYTAIGLDVDPSTDTVYVANQASAGSGVVGQPGHGRAHGDLL